MSLDAIQAVIFTLDGERFAIPVTLVREILDFRQSVRVPECPDWLVGLADVRDEAVPLIDLRVRIGLPARAADEATRILVIDQPAEDGKAACGAVAIGLVVDRVVDVLAFASADVEAPPAIGVRWHADYLEGVVRRDGGFIMLLDIAALSLPGLAAASLAAPA